MTQMTPSQLVQNNLGMRAALLASSPRMRKILGSFSGTEGGTTRVNLFNVGIVTELTIAVSANLTIGTAVATASRKAPWNAINRIRLTDFDGTDRVNCSGFQLWELNCIRNRTPYGYNNEGLAAVAVTPKIPTAVATDTLEFVITVPLAYNKENDLRGAILAQTNVGQMTLSIDWNSDWHRNGVDDGVYNGGATSTVVVNSITATVSQDYLLPQSIGGQIPIPMLDLISVYEIAGNLKVTDNIAAALPRLINYPNVRSVIGAYMNYENNGTAVLADFSKLRLIANGNNVLREYNSNDKMADQRAYINGDLRAGMFWELTREKPIETALYGNMQLEFTPALYTASANTYLEFMFESFYQKGQVLPGMSQSAG